MKYCTPNSACKTSANRRGSVAVIAMIAILITFSIGLGLVRTALLSRRESLRRQDQTQARWLVEAGIERGVAQLRESSDYEGETWELSAEEFGGGDAGRVLIELESSGDQENNYQLTVVADYPAEGDGRIRSRKVITIPRQKTTETDPDGS